jgi:hypothetical protein
VRTAGIVVAIVVILLVVALVVLIARRNQRRARLRERFGPEYDLAVRRGQDRRAVEQRLTALAERRDNLEIHDVAVEEHQRFARQWDDVQRGFVDDPGQAVADADGLLNTVLRSRGYPVDNFDDRVALVATDHQDIVERYRDAHDTYAGHLRTGSGETEPLRKAFLGYRDVFERLNQPAQHERGDDGALPGRSAPPALPDAEPAQGERAEAEEEQVEPQPVESQPVESQPVESQPVESQPVESQPVEPQQVEPAPAVAAEPAPAEAPAPPEAPAPAPVEQPEERPAAVRLDLVEERESSAPGQSR